MTNQQLRDWILDPARTMAELQAVAAHYGLPHAGILRHALVVSLVNHLNGLPPGDPATYVVPVAPVAPAHVAWIMRIGALVAGLQLVLDILGLIGGFLPDDLRRSVWLLVFGLTSLWFMALLVGAFVPALAAFATERRRLNAIHWGTIGTSLAIIGFVLVLRDFGIDPGAVWAIEMALLVAIIVVDVIISTAVIARRR